ncbi:MAG: hypothetical protein Q8859_11970 [Bacteroidota bacterium]|nr:hypothetical protein [Bacteroidota bacterium]
MGKIFKGAYVLTVIISACSFHSVLFGQQTPKHDSNGKLLPFVSYQEVIKRGMNFILYEHDKWFKGDKELLKDENGKALPAYVLYANLQRNGEPFTASIDRFVSYPAFHHAAYISTFLKYYEYSGDPEALAKARLLADWNIAHSTPKEWAYGNLPYSTYYQGKPGGFQDGNTIMTDKPAIMGSAYLSLYKATGDKRYLNASEQIALTLAKNQFPEGNWPFRVNPQTKEVKELYTSSTIYAVQLFEQLDSFNHNDHFKKNRDKAFNWIMQHPAKDLKWLGFYEDIANDTTNRTNYDCMDFIRYLLASKHDKKASISTALRLNNFIEKTFIDKPKGFEPAEGIREQIACFETMGDHSAHWAAMLADLYHLTGDKSYRDRSIQTMNLVTYQLEPSNIILLSDTYPQWWYSGHFITIYYFLDFLNSFPEFAPKGETHLLNSTCGAKDVKYGNNSLYYSTVQKSEDRIKLAFINKKITLNGKVLAQRKSNEGEWTYNEKTKILVLKHEKGFVQITGK